MQLKLLINMMLAMLLPSTAVHAAQVLTSGYLVMDRWMSWEEAQSFVPPLGAKKMQDPWVYTTMLSFADHEPSRIGSYWYQLPPLDPGQQQMSLDFNNHAYSAILWSSSRLASALHFSVGIPGKTEETEQKHFLKRVVTFNVESSEERWFLLVNFSFQGRNSGGFWSNPRVASGTELEKEKHLRLYLIFTCLGSLSIMLLYMLMMFFRRHEDKPSLFIAVICLGLMMRILGVEGIFSEILDPVQSSWPYIISRRVEYMSIAMINLSLLPFITSSFPQVKHSRKLFWAICGYSSFYLVSCAFVSLEALRSTAGLIQFPTLLCLAFVFYILIQAIRRGEQGAIYMLVASLMPIALFSFEIIHVRSGGNLRIGYFAGIVFVFMLSQFLARRVAIAYNRVNHLSQSLQAEVELQTSQIRHVMDHIPEGLFVIDKDKNIIPPYSRFMESIFPEENLNHTPVVELLGKHFTWVGEDRSILESVLESVLGEDRVNWDFNIDHFSERNLQAASQVYCLQWHPIERHGQVAQLLGIIRDITKVKQLEAETKTQEEDFQLLREFIQAPKDLMRSFLLKQNRLLGQMLEELQSGITARILKTVLTHLHTMKGNARQLHLVTLSQLCHASEHPLRHALLLNSNVPAEMVATEVRILWEQVKHYQRVFSHFFGEQSHQGTLASFNPEEIASIERWLDLTPDLDPHVKKILKTKIGADLKEWIAELCNEQAKLATTLGKKPPELIITELGECRCSAEFRDALLDALGHLIRNSLVHGIETADLRIKSGKPERGQICLALHGDRNLHDIRYFDDGQGLDVARILAKAQEVNLIQAGEAVPFKNLVELIFIPALTTADKVTDLAGRGIGMDAIRLLLEAASAEVHLEPRDPQINLLSDIRGKTYIPFWTVITCLKAS